ncbi:hypothetical protein PG988_007725 [Apiospora saccharicola]
MAKYLSFAILSVLTAHGTAADPNSRSSVTDPAGYDPHDICHRDVLVVGGGSSGVYSAIRLRDHGKTVMVAEKQGEARGPRRSLGGPRVGHRRQHWRRSFCQRRRGQRLFRALRSLLDVR